MEEELREALAGQDQQHEKSTKVCHQNIRYGMSLLKYVTKYLQLWYVTLRYEHVQDPQYSHFFGELHSL